MIYWILCIEEIFSWIVIGTKFDLMKKKFLFFEKVIQSPTNEKKRNSKK